MRAAASPSVTGNAVRRMPGPGVPPGRTGGSATMKISRHVLHLLSGRLPRMHRSGDWMVPTVIGIGIGIAAGVGIGVLFAPASGRETRRDLRHKTAELKERAR